MKTLLILIVLVAAGIVTWNIYQKSQAEKAAAEHARAAAAESKSHSLLDQARDAAVSAKDAVGDKLDQWHLSGSDIRRDLERTGEVVRTKAKEAGATVASATSNAKIVSYIKTKLALDKELSARAIEVSCDAGHVTLRGTVGSEALIGKAVAFALDTEGVVEVKSLLTVQSAAPAAVPAR